jgi:hypothetical protein
MAQPPQTEAVDGGTNIAQLCAAQKLLYADAIALARTVRGVTPRMLRRH